MPPPLPFVLCFLASSMSRFLNNLHHWFPDFWTFWTMEKEVSIALPDFSFTKYGYLLLKDTSNSSLSDSSSKEHLTLKRTDCHR